MRIAPVFNGDSVDRYNFIACLKTCVGGNTGRLDHADIRAQLGHAEGKAQTVKQNGQNQISQRTGSDNGDAPGRMLLVKGVGQICFCHLAFARIDHFNVTAQRNRGKTPLGIAAFSGEKGLTEADGKAHDFNAAPAGNNIVSELMQADQNQNGDDKG